MTAATPAPSRRRCRACSSSPRRARCRRSSPELTPAPGELVIRKRQASAFFGTELAGWLHYRGVDTLLVAGCTTSGCIRASVVDGVSHNFRTVVLTDCVGDRAIGPHEANLFDMGQKYADLRSSDEVMGHYRKADAA